MANKNMIDISLFHSFLGKEQADALYTQLFSSNNWQKELKKDDGTLETINRKMDYVSDDGSYIYHYVNLNVIGHTWVDYGKLLTEVRDELSAFCKTEFNSVLLNLYESGKDGIGWHSDREEQLGESPVIGTLNLGSTRLFRFKDKITGEVFPYPVANGDLLIMHENCQRNFLHSILPENGITGARISLTFRKVISNAA